MRSNSPSSIEQKKRVKKKPPHEIKDPYDNPKEKFISLMNYIDHERAINNPFIKIRNENP